jgi:hypothetical protein
MRSRHAPACAFDLAGLDSLRWLLYAERDQGQGLERRVMAALAILLAAIAGIWRKLEINRL